MPENYAFGRRPPVPLWNQEIKIVVGEPMEFNLPELRKMALSDSRDSSSSSGRWPRIAALGKDAELLDRDFIQKMCENPERIRILVPPIATPSGLVEALGLGLGRKVLCPVPLVIGLDEPPVVPKFLEDLSKRGWIPVRLDAYETRWAGAKCAVDVVRKSEEECGFDAIVFTSTGEVEGLLKSLKEFDLD
ncbi:uncharacterized protein LOC129899020 [Solanum dulcamara]|uniref:uncharacterized protein LOC129899020 n=1 Tax=Solanum dulcamara TaxID=45834 RepID=UPI002485B8D9|nr:uncharacterized protein LOC129899020 [Solanum dulcamara]